MSYKKLLIMNNNQQLVNFVVEISKYLLYIFFNATYLAKTQATK